MAPILPLQDAQHTIAEIEAALIAGFTPPGRTITGIAGAVVVAANNLGLGNHTTVNSRLKSIKQRYNLEPDWSKWVDPRKIEYRTKDAPQKPVIIVRQHSAEQPEGPIYDVLAIGDAHDCPQLPDKSRFKWIGKYAAEHRPDYIVQMGDWLTLDSVSQHEPNDTARGKFKPSFDQDVASGKESMGAFCREIPNGYRPRKFVLKGNHEDRADQWENFNPEAQGIFVRMVDDIFGQGGFDIVPYGQFLFIGGVGFIHFPRNQMGKFYGGKFPEQQIANDAVFDIVCAHTHKERNAMAPKIGPNKFVRVINVGCALPHGEIEPYADKATTGWTYGIYHLKIQGAHVQDRNFISMLELERRYG